MSNELVVKILQAEECEKLASHLLGHECRCDPSKLYKVSIRLHEPAEQHQASKIADALEACDWSDTPIGNKAIILSAVQALRAALELRTS